MKIEIRTIPHHEHRYETVGDWQANEKGELCRVLVSDMPNMDYEFLIALHELIEGYLCQVRLISDEKVTQFDEAYEAKRPEGDESEPGDDPMAPYHREHQFASRIEKMMAKELGVDWETYDEAVSSL